MRVVAEAVDDSALAVPLVVAELLDGEPAVVEHQRFHDDVDSLETALHRFGLLTLWGQLPHPGPQTLVHVLRLHVLAEIPNVVVALAVLKH